MTMYFLQAFIYLSAAVITVPIAKRLGLGSVLGYLIAGVIIGPVVGLVGDETSDIQHFAEFGVVMMLFLVGLELEPKLLWRMRHRLIGLGGLQVVVSTAVIMAIALLFKISWQTGLAIGLIFSLSSTAIVLQTLKEKKLSHTEGGKNAFSVLLFQDIAVIPMLAFIPLLALSNVTTTPQNAIEHQTFSLITDMSGFTYAITIAAAIGIIITGGHFLSRPLFRYVASSGLREIFTATALMLVIGIATLMNLIGLSPALGTFLAGVILANSEFKHELESNIEPFKGLLLGLFFITVGAGIDFSLFYNHFFTIAGFTVAVMAAKALVLFKLSRIFKMSSCTQWLFALSLCQAGEFGFVLLGFSVQNHVLPEDMANILSLVVALSMFLTPGIFILFDRMIRPNFKVNKSKQESDTFEDQGSVIIAGIGRFGQIINRLLSANGVETVILDHQTTIIDKLRYINTKCYYGDATRPDLLHHAGIEKAKLLIVAIDDKEQAIQLVEYAKHAYPNLKILARSFDRGHGYQLRQSGADVVITETFRSALEMGVQALNNLGFHRFESEQLRAAFLNSEKALEDDLYDSWLQQSQEEQKTNIQYRNMFMLLEETINKAMERKRSGGYMESRRQWTPPPKHYHAQTHSKTAPAETPHSATANTTVETDNHEQGNTYIPDMIQDA